MKYLLLLLIISTSAFSYPFKKPRDVEKLIREYNNLHRKFFKFACRPGDEQKFDELMREYNGEGYYIPELKENIDLNAIRLNFPLLKEKTKWLKGIEQKLTKSSIPNFKLISEPLYNTIDELLYLRKKYDLSLTQKEKEAIRLESIKNVTKLKKSFELFTEQVYFLKSFKFPVDHLKNRIEYVNFSEKGKQEKANRKYFYRKIVEDGAYDKDNTRADKFLRSTIDTLALNIPKLKDFLTEPIRFDLLYILEKTEKEMGNGKSKLLERISYWKERSQNAYNFYNKILKNAKLNNFENHKLMLKKLKAQKNLQNYVNQKQVDTYKFWASKSEIMKALYSMETIIFNEVGRVDGPNALERKDVAKVILNRVKIPFFQKLDHKQDLYEIFSKEDKLKSENEKWLNVLFRKGEFSFTYYYISGNLKIFCPDQTATGKYLRRQNIKISLNALWEEDKTFKATRYFSRASMNGRIDMSSVWTDYEAINERPGLKIKRQSALLKYYKANAYKYLYEFIDPTGRKFEVVEIKNEVYTLNWQNKKPVFYTYRSPHYFKYFVAK